MFHMLFAYSGEKNNHKKFKKNILPTYLAYFFEHVTPSVIPRRNFTPLNQYGRLKTEPKFFKMLPILFNFNQFKTVHSSYLIISKLYLDVWHQKAAK